MATETFTNSTLSLTVSEDTQAISVIWKGRSTARDPA